MKAKRSERFHSSCDPAGVKQGGFSAGKMPLSNVGSGRNTCGTARIRKSSERGLTLVDLDPSDALVSVAVFASALRIDGSGRTGKAREEVLRGPALEPYLGRRARKGRRQDALPKATRVVAADAP